MRHLTVELEPAKPTRCTVTNNSVKGTMAGSPSVTRNMAAVLKPTALSSSKIAPVCVALSTRTLLVGELMFSVNDSLASKTLSTLGLKRISLDASPTAKVTVPAGKVPFAKSSSVAALVSLPRLTVQSTVALWLIAPLRTTV